MELNPNHGVTNELREQWYKLCAILLFKSGQTTVVISAEDIERFVASGMANITMRPHGETLTLSLVTDAEAKRLAHQEGGLAF